MKEEVKLINYEMLGSLIFIGTITISIIISYNNKLKIEKKEPLFDDITSRNILITNKLIAFLTVVFFLYLNYKGYKLTEAKNKDTTLVKAQFIPSILAFISALYVLNLSLKQGNNDISSNENPEI